jgi:hypothetical protein
MKKTRNDGLPDCKIVSELIRKSSNKRNYDFNYIQELDKIRSIVSIEVAQINQLFPEYTPHDERYHLKKLFYVADQMLGDALIESMNVTELFLLALCLYCHDWGMAVSDNEKLLILSQSDSSHLLDNEALRIREFCKGRNLNPSQIDFLDWQEYVRLTHAFRSGKRIRNYFEAISPGVAEFGSRVCEGHWLDFEVIDDHTSYPTDASIHRDIVNVKALTIYVRLIDLLDLGEDRTPFVLWKFVAPRNKFSKLEWAKHRALQPVTFPQYQLSRYIQVEGSTDDHNVYVSIMDFKRYVDAQFRQCSDILNRINHNYHKLNISHIDWRIAARGFEPLAIQFDFDRNRMFEILSDDIYESNPYVFIRELLQNAIDAITMRTEVLAKRDLKFNPKIAVEVEEEQEFYVVKIVDNGVGMDEYIIRNYLAVAGKSYYKSADFVKEGLNMDPISRFGIGVLSCFMVADFIEIKTFKDPHTTQKQDHLCISIPAKENFFRVKKNAEVLNIGTAFRVWVLKSRLPIDNKNNKINKFDVEGYLRKIAGFVRYPIFIRQGDIESVINNPDEPSLSDRSFQLKYDFDYDEAFLPQHIDSVKKYFVEKRIHLKEQLGLSNFDGCITFLLPKCDTIDIVNDDRSWPVSEVRIVNLEDPIEERRKVQWHNHWSDFRRSYANDEFTLPKSSYKVFLDGILIPHIESPEVSGSRFYENDEDYSRRFREKMLDTFVCPQIIVNIPKPNGMKIDLARTRIESNERWDYQIWRAFFKYLGENDLKMIAGLEPDKRLLSLSRLITFYRVACNILVLDLIERFLFPIPVLIKGGNLTFEDFDRTRHKVLKLVPELFSGEVGPLLESHYFKFGSSSLKKNTRILELWAGENALINCRSLRSGGFVSSISNIGPLVISFINRNYFMASVEFISSPLGSNFPLVQEIFRVLPQKIDDNSSFDHLGEFNVDNLDEYSISILRQTIRAEFSAVPKLVKFPSSFKTKFSYSFKYLNIEHPIVQSFVRICLFLTAEKAKKTLKSSIAGRLSDLVKDLPFMGSYYPIYEEFELNVINKKVNTLFEEADSCGIIKHRGDVNISIADFVDNSVSVHSKGKFIKIDYDYTKYFAGKKYWGEVIK